MVYFRADPRGCDVALRATWQRHAGPRGAYMAIGRIFIFTYIVDIIYIVFQLSEEIY